jgi:hypothetical protein
MKQGKVLAFSQPLAAAQKQILKAEQDLATLRANLATAIPEQLSQSSPKQLKAVLRTAIRKISVIYDSIE